MSLYHLIVVLTVVIIVVPSAGLWRVRHVLRREGLR